MPLLLQSVPTGETISRVKGEDTGEIACAACFPIDGGTRRGLRFPCIRSEDQDLEAVRVSICIIKRSLSRYIEGESVICYQHRRPGERLHVLCGKRSGSTRKVAGHYMAM